MQAQNTLFYKVQQQHSNKQAFYVLCSFALNAAHKLTQAQAISCETLQHSMQHPVTFATVATVVAKLQQQHNAASVTDVTTDAVFKLLTRNTKRAAA